METRALTGERGAYRPAGPIQSVQLPATAQAILAARIDRLAPGDKRLLQAAAAVGKDVPFPLLEAIAEEPEERLREGLARLQAAEFLYEARLFPDLEYTFKHALTHEVAYGGLLKDRRRAVHAGALEAMERLYADRLDEHVERLAHHALRGEMWEKAVMYLRNAGTRATERSAYREASSQLEEVLGVLPHLPDTRERVALEVDVRVELQITLRAIGKLSQLLDHSNAARNLAESLGDRRRLGLV